MGQGRSPCRCGALFAGGKRLAPTEPAGENAAFCGAKIF